MRVNIKPNSIDFDTLKYYLVNEFPKTRIWELSDKKLLAQKNFYTGCYIIPGRRNVWVFGGFPEMKVNIIAIIIFFIGGFLIPTGLYLLLFFKSHKNLEKAVGEAISKKFAKYYIIKK
jgi:hypothetical protein